MKAHEWKKWLLGREVRTHESINEKSMMNGDLRLTAIIRQDYKFLICGFIQLIKSISSD